MFNEKRVKGKPKEKEKNEDKDQDQDQKKGEMMIFKTNKKEVAYQQVPGLEGGLPLSIVTLGVFSPLL